jgi:uncharacterized membrane protein YjgN (DUF898 family)
MNLARLPATNQSTLEEPVMTDLALVPPPVPPPSIPPPQIPPLLPVPPPIPLRLGATGCFTGPMQVFRRIILRGALLQVATFGIYRFWLTTDARRFLWANTEIGGDSLEYSGTAMELFLGFLMAIALLVPVYVLLFVGSLELGLVSQLSSMGAFVFLAVFGQYAYYRARRYRLTRTIFRGIRFHQSGSALAYALRSLMWGVVTVFTLGLAYPWAQASLERYKLAHTHYGGWDGTFAGSGTRLFVRGIGLWLLLIVALVAFGVAVGLLVDKDALVHATTRAGANEPKAALEVVKLMGLGFGVVVVAAAAYTMLQAIVTRWWLEGLRIGPLAVATTLRKRTIIGAYLRCFLYAALLMIVLSIVVSLGVGTIAVAVKPPDDVGQLVMVGSAVAAYLVMALGIWVLYQTTVKLRVWRLAVDSISLAGFEAIAHVRADTSLPSSAVGEGLADALGAGGI